MAVPAKTVTEETSPYAVNKALFEESSSIKENMKLVENRLQKMEEHRVDVSESVYFKVRTDYETQLDSVREAFQAKCQEIEAELRNLYVAQDEQETKMQGHQEILEEARFRHKLGEFTDKKFKDVENTQSKEIKKYSDILEIIKQSIKQYEDVLGGAYTPSAEPVRKEPVKVSPPSSPKVAEPPAAPAKKAATAPEPPTSKNAFIEEDTMKNLSDTAKASSSVAKVPEPPPSPAPSGPSKGFEDKLSDDLDMFLQDEGDYFSSDMEEAKPEAAPEIPQVATPAVETPAASQGKGLDDSLSSILRDIPFDEEPSETQGAAKAVGEETGARLDMNQFPEASLILIEGDLDENEFILGDNTSIGRSPSNDIVLKETKVSRQHAAINLRGGSYVIVDLKSSNGLLVNGRKVEEAVLNDGDELTIGSFKFQFNLV